MRKTWKFILECHLSVCPSKLDFKEAGIRDGWQLDSASIDLLLSYRLEDGDNGDVIYFEIGLDEIISSLKSDASDHRAQLFALRRFFEFQIRNINGQLGQFAE